EVSRWNERVAIRNQSKVKSDAHAPAAEPEPDSRVEISSRRQRRPAAVRVGIAPGYPGRTPRRVRRPDPAAGRAAIPAAIMKGRPAPGIIGLPIPAAVAPEPAPAVAVRPPIHVDDRNAWLPAPAVIGNFHPASVGSQVFIEIIV